MEVISRVVLQLVKAYEKEADSVNWSSAANDDAAPDQSPSTRWQLRAQEQWIYPTGTIDGNYRWCWREVLGLGQWRRHLRAAIGAVQGLNWIYGEGRRAPPTCSNFAS